MLSGLVVGLNAFFTLQYYIIYSNMMLKYSILLCEVSRAEAAAVFLLL